MPSGSSSFIVVTKLRRVKDHAGRRRFAMTRSSSSGNTDVLKIIGTQEQGP